MRVLIVNTSENTGGAAIAAGRLMEALKNNGVKAKMLVRDKRTEQITVATLPQTATLRLKFLWERFVIWWHNHCRREDLFTVDIANTGTDITQLPEFKEADIVHLHWINQGFLSLRNIRRIIDSGKPVVWTMHDMWPFTGICHYSGSCTQYRQACTRCSMLCPNGGHNALAPKVFRRKQRMLRGAQVTFVACSRWLERLAQQSSLLRGQDICSIPNTIDSHIFSPAQRRQLRLKYNLPTDKTLLLFSAQRVTDPRKGICHLMEACRMLVEKHPDEAADMAIVAVGGEAQTIDEVSLLPVYGIEYVADEKQMAELYNTADAYVTPSLQDNLPNTIMEAMACGIPCVGFATGGIPEMIDHMENGYVATPGNPADLAEGIRYVTNPSRCQALGTKARQKVMATYAQGRVASLYIQIYQRLLAHTD